MNPRTIAGTSSADLPTGALALLGPIVPSFDPTDATTIYTSIATNGGSAGLFKIHYTGNWTTLNIPWQSNASPPVTGELTWQNMTPSAAGRDMRTQILANTTYSEALWGSLSSLQSVGTSGKYSVFEHLIGGQVLEVFVIAVEEALPIGVGKADVKQFLDRGYVPLLEKALKVVGSECGGVYVMAR